MQIIKRDTRLWNYLTPELQGLIEDGEMMIKLINDHRHTSGVSDFSLLVFSFSKAYEGFLKKFLLDMKLIKESDYYGDDMRIGRILNPHFIKQKGNVFAKVCVKAKDGRQVSEDLWRVWKRGRNLVFHYFPHNFRKLSFEESMEIVDELVSVMDQALLRCKF